MMLLWVKPTPRLSRSGKSSAGNPLPRTSPARSHNPTKTSGSRFIVGQPSAPLFARHRLLPDRAFDALPLGAHHIGQLAEPGIPGAGKAAGRVEQSRVDAAVIPHRRVDMRVQDAGEHDVGVAVGIDVLDLAFEMR